MAIDQAETVILLFASGIALQAGGGQCQTCHVVSCAGATTTKTTDLGTPRNPNKRVGSFRNKGSDDIFQSPNQAEIHTDPFVSNWVVGLPK
jgi:hypothetical protein